MRITLFSRDKILHERLYRHFIENTIELDVSTHSPDNDELNGVDVAVIDLKFNSLKVVNRLHCPTVVLSEIPNFTEAQSALSLGARGYGNRQMRVSNLVQAIENVQEGQIWLPPSIISSLITVIGQSGSKNPNTRDEFLAMLSEREQEVTLCIAEGLSNQQIADKLYISQRTVKAHLGSIYEKTGVKNRLELGISVS